MRTIKISDTLYEWIKLTAEAAMPPEGFEGSKNKVQEWAAIMLGGAATEFWQSTSQESTDDYLEFIERAEGFVREGYPWDEAIKLTQKAYRRDRDR